MDLKWIIFGTSCIVILLLKVLYQNLNNKLRQEKLGRSAKNAPHFLPFGKFFDSRKTGKLTTI
jgi:hypothetical protein